MREEKLDITDLVRADGLMRVRAVYDVFPLIAEIEAFRARPGMRNREGILGEAYYGLKSALLTPERSESRFITYPWTHLKPEFAHQAPELDADPKPHIRVSARVNQSGNLCVTFSTSILGQDGRWHHAEEWARAPDSSSYWGDRPEDEVLHVIRVRDLLYRTGLGRSKSQPDWWHKEISLASRAVLAAYRHVVQRLSARFHVQEDTHVVGVFADGTDNAECLGLEIVSGLDEYRASLSTVAFDFRTQTGIDPGVFWHMFGSGPAEAASVSRRLRSRAGKASDLTPGAVRYWRNQLERAVRYGLWSVPPTTEEQVACRERMEHHRTALAEAKTKGSAASNGRDPRYSGAYGRLSDEMRTEFGVEDVHGLVALLNEARAANGQRPIPQGDFPSNKANLAKAVHALRDFRQDAVAGPSS